MGLVTSASTSWIVMKITWENISLKGRSQYIGLAVFLEQTTHLSGQFLFTETDSPSVVSFRACPFQVFQPAVPGLIFNAVSFSSLSLSPHLDKSQSSTCAKLDLFLNYYPDAQGCASWGPKFRSWAGRACLHLPLKYPHLSLGSSELSFLFRGLSVATVLGMHLSFCTDRNLYPLKSRIGKSMIVSGLFP